MFITTCRIHGLQEGYADCPRCTNIRIKDIERAEDQSGASYGDWMDEALEIKESTEAAT